MKKLLLSVLFIIGFGFAFSVGMGSGGEALRVRDGSIKTFDEMVADAKKSEIVFIGELHDFSEHHQLELNVIRALHESGTPVVIGLEMFRADSQRSLDNWVSGNLPLNKFLPVYYDNWREDWTLYENIISYAREHGIPLIGLNIPDRIAKTVAQKGFTSLNASEKKQLPPEISCDVDPTYMNFIRRAYADHAPSVGKKFLNFCEAQMIWDKSMAWHIVQYLKANPGKKMVVLAGVGHAWRRGIPEQVDRLTNYPSTVILPIIPGQVEPDSVTVRDTDYVVLR
ncbi:MAG TPA: ChaN family lipoprotein [Nitrospirota bacterium]|nr:ChaN family lipoprotein [Nitrospirota bacterium]